MFSLRDMFSVFTLLWFTLEFFPARSQEPSLGGPSQELDQDLGHDQLLVPCFPTTSLQRLLINLSTYYLCLSLNSFWDKKNLSFIKSWDKLCGFSWKIGGWSPIWGVTGFEWVPLLRCSFTRSLLTTIPRCLIALKLKTKPSHETTNKCSSQKVYKMLPHIMPLNLSAYNPITFEFLSLLYRGKHQA